MAVDGVRVMVGEGEEGVTVEGEAVEVTVEAVGVPVADEVGVAVKEEVMSFLKSNRESSQVLFADPPYEYDSYDDLLGAMCVRERLTENGMVVLEHASRVHFNEHPNFVFERKYGQSAFSFFGAVPGNPPAL